ncbi:glycosyltransferase family 4 protein [Puniceibacterium sp. IMCC21224]|uniref:glycosyltransferase family 4 protein n=1 Tax=Puniceibacterium sp. IMCC21224 TaxID=1618204 RepID=UPI00065D5F47|nr:glycosyltransferase family 4 protein [Puniceibacterium sp. IMCC21224]KMK63825.1 glycosyltransferase [Puniceibacterium sp. IMCC21224]
MLGGSPETGSETDDDTESDTGTTMRILLLAIGSEGYGVRRVWGGLLQGLSARGHAVTLVLLKGEHAPAWDDIRPADVDLITPESGALPEIAGTGLAKLVTLGRRALRQVALARWLRTQVRARAISRVVVQSPMDVGLAALAVQGTGAVVFWMMPNAVSSGYRFDLNRRIYRGLFRGMNVVPVANSQFTGATLGSGRFRRHVLHLGIDTERFAPAAVPVLPPRPANIPPDVPLLGLFARLTEEKGHLVLAHALARAGGDAHVLICGGPLDSAFADRLRAGIAALGLGGRMHLLGPQDDIVPLYALCDVVLNTRLDPEPFGMSVIEAMAMGKPVLAHRAGGPGETVIDGQTGWLIDAPTRDSFAAGLDRMLADRARWGTMGAAARRHVCANFAEPRMVAGLEAIMAAPSNT